MPVQNGGIDYILNPALITLAMHTGAEAAVAKRIDKSGTLWVS